MKINVAILAKDTPLANKIQETINKRETVEKVYTWLISASFPSTPDGYRGKMMEEKRDELIADYEKYLAKRAVGFEILPEIELHTRIFISAVAFWERADPDM